jgi:hypothetical protein
VASLPLHDDALSLLCTGAVEEGRMSARLATGYSPIPPLYMPPGIIGQFIMSCMAAIIIISFSI